MKAWLHDHPWQADGLLAVALLAVTSQVLAGQADPTARAAFAVVTVVLAATVIPRRRYPVAAFTVAAAIGAAQIAFGVQNANQAVVFALQPTDADLAILVLLYTLAAYRPRPVSIAGLVAGNPPTTRTTAASSPPSATWSPSPHEVHPAPLALPLSLIDLTRP